MIRGIAFDINGTLVDILTNEADDGVYRVLSNLLDYQGISISPDKVRRLYFEINKRQRRCSPEPFPEFDVVALFREILKLCGSDRTRFAAEGEAARTAAASGRDVPGGVAVQAGTLSGGARSA